MAVGLLLAILIDQRVRGEAVWRTIYLYPLAVSFVVTGTVWSWLYNPASGIEFLVARLGLDGLRVRAGRPTASSRSTRSSSPASGRPRGFAMALFLAGLRSVDQDLIKAAQIDGAGMVRIYRRIVISGDRPDLHRGRWSCSCSSPSRPSTSRSR